jgi:hypothetical protein
MFRICLAVVAIPSIVLGYISQGAITLGAFLRRSDYDPFLSKAVLADKSAGHFVDALWTNVFSSAFFTDEALSSFHRSPAERTIVKAGISYNCTFT